VEIVGNEEVLDMEDPTFSPESDMFIEDLQGILTDDQKTIVQCILQDPSTLKESGKININLIAKKLDRSWNEVSILVKDLGRKISNEL
jgi:hypothetical protein